jgi:hypothetical protein
VEINQSKLCISLRIALKLESQSVSCRFGCRVAGADFLPGADEGPAAG